MAEKSQEKSETPKPATAVETNASEETPVVTPPEATATAPETTPPIEPKPPETEAAGKVAVGVEGYEKMVAEAKTKSADAKNKPPEKSAVEASTETPLGEETPPAEAAAASADVVAEETPPAEEKEPPSRIRIGRLGEKDRGLLASATELAAAEGIEFSVAWARVTGKPADTAPVTETPPAETVLRTREQIEADITAKKAEKKQAATDLDTGKMYESDEAIEALRNELSEVNAAESQAEEDRKTAEQTKFAATVADAKARAVKDWPEVGDDNSEFSKRMVELADQLEKDTDPELRNIVYDADAPFTIAKMVAKELGILPKHLRKAPASAPAATPNGATKPSTSTATKPAPVNQRAVGRPTQPAASPASGAARTTQGGPEDRLGLDKIHSVTDYEKVVERAKKLVPA